MQVAHSSKMLSFHARSCTRAPRSIIFRQFSNTASRAKTVAKPSPRPPTSSSSPLEKGRADRIQSQAARIFQAGREEIYRNTASNGYVAASLSILVVSYTGIGYLYSTRLWDLETAKARGLHWGVPVAYQATMICWGVLAAYAFSRTLGITKSIRLVKSGDKVLLQTSIRRPIPFMKPEKHFSEPQDLVVSRSKLYSATLYEDMIVAPEGDSLVSKITKNLFYAPFHNIRKALGGVGLVPIQIGPTGSQRHVLLDTDGKFSEGGKDLLDLSKDEF